MSNIKKSSGTTSRVGLPSSQSVEGKEHPKYNSPYPSEITYRSDKNFLVRLKAMIDRSLSAIGHRLPHEFYEQFDNAEEYLFAPSSTPQSVEGKEQDSEMWHPNYYPHQSVEGQIQKQLAEKGNQLGSIVGTIPDLPMSDAFDSYKEKYGTDAAVGHAFKKGAEFGYSQLVGDKEREIEKLYGKLEYAMKGFPEHEKDLMQTQVNLLQKINEQAQKEVEELKDLLRDIDKSLYIGKDLDDTEILKWYLDVCQTIKESIQKKLNREPKDKRSVARDDDSSNKAY